MHLIQHCSVGIGSGFDGTILTPEGLEDVSRYPALVWFFPPTHKTEEM